MVVQPRVSDLELQFICPWHNKEEVFALPPSYGGVSGFFEGEIPCPSSNKLVSYLLAITVDLTSDPPRLEKIKCGKKLNIDGPVITQHTYYEVGPEGGSPQFRFADKVW